MLEVVAIRRKNAGQESDNQCFFKPYYFQSLIFIPHYFLSGHMTVLVTLFQSQRVKKKRNNEWEKNTGTLLKDEIYNKSTCVLQDLQNGTDVEQKTSLVFIGHLYATRIFFLFFSVVSSSAPFFSWHLYRTWCNIIVRSPQIFFLPTKHGLSALQKLWKEQKQ